MNRITEDKKRSRRIFLYLWILIALLALLVCATYTWFSLSTRPRVSSMEMYISSGAGLELAKTYDAPDSEWGQEIDGSSVIGENVSLKPATWSETKQKLIAVNYGADGRITDVSSELDDTADANRPDGYYALGTFYARTDQSCKVSLAEAVAVNGGENASGTYVIGTPVWNSETILHDDGGSGAESAVRLGFKLTQINPATGEDISDSVMFIYEPNSDKHTGGETGYIPTPSIDGTDTLSPRLITQSASLWTDGYPVQRKVILHTPGKFDSNPTLFSVKAGEIYKIQLYIWLEGQDADCTNYIRDAMILTNIGFKTDYSGQTGLEEIPQN